MSEPPIQTDIETVDRQQAINALYKLSSGKVLSQRERELVGEYLKTNPSLEAIDKAVTSGGGGRKKSGLLTRRQRKFVELQFDGQSAAGAYVQAFGRENISNRLAAQSAYKINQFPAVKRYSQELAACATAKTVLTINDRLAILAKDAQLPGTSPSAAQARARSIKIYNETAGDHAPERHEVSGPGGVPIALSAELTGPLVKRLTATERLAQLRAQRELASAAAPEQPAETPAVPAPRVNEAKDPNEAIQPPSPQAPG